MNCFNCTFQKIHYLLFSLLFTAMAFCQVAGQSYESTISWQSVNAAERVTETIVKSYSGEPGKEYPVERTVLEGFAQNATLIILEADTFNGSLIPLHWPAHPLNVYQSVEIGKVKTVLELCPAYIKDGKSIFIRRYKIVYELRGKEQAGSDIKLNKKAVDAAFAGGDWYKLKLSESGVYKIDREMALKIGLNLSTVSLKQVKIFGNGGAMLPEPIKTARPADAEQIAIWVNDANNNDKWDGEDYLLFWAQGVHTWQYASSAADFNYAHNLYADETFYFLTVSTGDGKRIVNRSNGNSNAPLIEINSYDFMIHREFAEVNVIKSGREWYGELFRNSNTIDFKEQVDNPFPGQQISFRARLGVRSLTQSNLSVSVNGNNLIYRSFFPVSGEYDQVFMTAPEVIQGSFIPASSAVNISMTYSKPALSSFVYLDYYELRGVSLLKWSKGQLAFRKKGTDLNGYIRYRIEGQPAFVWDVTDRFNTVNQQYAVDGSNAVFTNDAGGKLHEFVMFNPSDAKTPIFDGKLPNQNLHGLTDIEYVIIAAPEFAEQAQRLGEFHKKEDGYTYVVATPQQVYNEFSSGTADVTAFRDFAKYLYDRNSTAAKKFRFLLLFGDASYDYKNRLKNNTNFVPTYESFNSYNPPYSYCSDDYFAILDDSEGYWGSDGVKEGLDIGIGRIPADDVYQAETFVDKIISYKSAEGLGDWRNRITFLGDDEDNNNHFNDCEQVTGIIYNQAPLYNINKIYLDAFKQEVFGSGQKYPDVNVAIDQSFDKGHLIFNYLGHGGVSGMAHERVVTRPQIQAWKNNNKLPLIVTATCELSRFDDPSLASAGELMLFNENGGGIAMVTASRLVYIGLNKDLNVALFDHNLLSKTENRWPTLGEVYMVAKNNSARAENQRNFILLGDPALTLNYPKGKLAVTSIAKSGPNELTDTLKALEAVSIEGEVLTADSVLDTGFNGTVYPTVFDKFLTFRTLGNDQASIPAPYQLQNSVLYSGKVSAVNGKFKFSFVVPKDIAYQYGFGKISLYAENGTNDAAGHYTQFYIGGTSTETTVDTTKPAVQIFMEDYSFKYGDMTSDKPLLLARVFDQNGINTVGNGIGRDITATLDKGTEYEKLFILNDYYRSKLDSYQEGEIIFPFETLSKGKHTMHLKLWDVYNNSADAHTEFIVGASSNTEINEFFAYPNPSNGHFTLVINHNKPGEDVETVFQIISMEGKIIVDETLQINAAQSRIELDANMFLNASGLSQGLYIGRVVLKDKSGNQAAANTKIFVR